VGCITGNHEVDAVVGSEATNGPNSSQALDKLYEEDILYLPSASFIKKSNNADRIAHAEGCVTFFFSPCTANIDWMFFTTCQIVM
jgi:hypothetical protein